jgi:glycosyltransferase involved in cell wall biosynthesis
MKILFVHTKYKERGGEDSVVESEMQLLKESGHEVNVLYFDNSKHSMLSLLLLPFNIFSYIKTIRAINRFQPEVVHLHNLHFAASPSVIWAVKNKKIPVVKTLHNYRMLCPSGTLFHDNEMYVKSLNSSFPWDAVKRKVYRNSQLLTFWLAFAVWLHKRIGTFRKIDRYITLNEKCRSIFLSSDLKLKNTQIVMKPNFIWHHTSTSSPARENHFLYIGRLSPEKGIDVLLKAFAATSLPLTIIGDGPLRDKVIEQQQQNPNIKWLGFQNKEVINTELQLCNALIVPSVCLEGMPLTIVEGFAASTPVITSKLGAMETIVTHNYNGLLFTPNNADSLAKQLHKWQSFSAIKKNEFAAHALHTYESKYTPQKNLVALLAIYHEAMGKKATRAANRQPQYH